ncbi:D-sedoheptulose-7-phosphate isomerase [Actinotalea caeni]|uniref:D-sedoheptulose-7-phosphate isomerase n=1 Tax=Actinotalea caeni TaxID=1348467 RepID=UPI001F044548|nr:SIS domain-containing protein [Actinotalea caeni]
MPAPETPVDAPAWMRDQLEDHRETAARAAALLPIAYEVGRRLVACFEGGGTLWTFGNGGSAADAQHLTGELIGHYRRDRRPLPAVTLTTDATVTSCIANDYAWDEVFARQLRALARPTDVVAAFSTSGRSPNVVAGLRAARANGATTVLFGGADGGPAAGYADLALVVPSDRTPRIQEVHTFLLHAISEMLDAWADVDVEPSP